MFSRSLLTMRASFFYLYLKQKLLIKTETNKYIKALGGNESKWTLFTDQQ